MRACIAPWQHTTKTISHFMKILIFSHEIYKAIWFDLIFLKPMDTRALSSRFRNHRNIKEKYGFSHSNNIHLAKVRWIWQTVWKSFDYRLNFIQFVRSINGFAKKFQDLIWYLLLMAVQNIVKLRLKIKQALENGINNIQSFENTVISSPSPHNNNEIKFDTLRQFQLAMCIVLHCVLLSHIELIVLRCMDCHNSISSWIECIPYIFVILFSKLAQIERKTKVPTIYFTDIHPLCVSVYCCIFNVCFAFLSLTGFVRL